MQNFLNRISNKRAFLVSVIMVLLYFVSYFNKVLELPSVYRNFCCADDRKLNLFLIFIPIFLFSFILFKLNSSVFEKWKKFTLIYLFIYIVIYLLSPTQGDGFIWFQRETVSLFGSVIYLVLSLLLILYKSLRKD